ncbi:Uncharacterised protein [Turicibacter sanguinis]|nr:Uncharacterised protein [Turicibacter sanguinis]
MLVLGTCIVFVSCAITPSFKEGFKDGYNGETEIVQEEQETVDNTKSEKIDEEKEQEIKEKEEQEVKEKAEAEQKAKEEEEAKAQKEEDERKAKEEQERKEAEQKAKEEEEAKAQKEEDERKAKEEQERKEAEEKAKAEEEAKQKELENINFLAQKWVDIVNESYESDKSFYTVDEESKIIYINVDVPEMRSVVEALAMYPSLYAEQWNEVVVGMGEVPTIAKQTLDDLGLNSWSVAYNYGDASGDCYWVSYYNDVLIYNAYDKIAESL